MLFIGCCLFGVLFFAAKSMRMFTSGAVRKPCCAVGAASVYLREAILIDSSASMCRASLCGSGWVWYVFATFRALLLAFSLGR